MTLTISDLCDYFDRMGWHIQKRDTQTIFCLFAGDQRDFLLCVYLDEQWASFSITDYLPKLEPGNYDKVEIELLESNSQMRLVKFSLLEGGQIVLSADLPVLINVNFDLFTVYVDAITFYANSLHGKLFKLITGKDYAIQEKASDE